VNVQRCARFQKQGRETAGLARQKVPSVTAFGNEVPSRRHTRETTVAQKAQAAECWDLALKRRESNAFQPRTGTNPGED
jgi:hypothetical protein